jgi:hypothetical protein
MESIGDTSGEFQVVPWSGGNDKDARSEGAAKLKEAVDTFRSENPDEPVNVVGYSHGGNIVIEAANNGVTFDNAITVATPVRDDYQPVSSSAMGNWINVYSLLDGVQINGGDLISPFGEEIGPAGRTYDEEKNPNGTNVKASQGILDYMDLMNAGWLPRQLPKPIQEHLDMQNEKGPEALKDYVVSQEQIESEEEQ